MRILHTSDWHVGRSLHRISRLDETRAALTEISEIAEREQVDAIVVCGDVFENLSPTAEAEDVVYEALERFSIQGLSIVLVTGNHDHPGRWKALTNILRRVNVHVASDFHPADDGGIIEISSRDGRETLQVATVPWVSERRMYGMAELMGGGESSYQSYAQGMGDAIKNLCEGFDGHKANMLAGHLFISGSIPSGTERPLTMGEIYAVTPNAIPPTVQYAALGHVHRAQDGPGVATPCRYAGSILALDFGDVDRGTQVSPQKTVEIVDVEPGKPAKHRSVILSSGKRLRDIRGTLDELSSLQTEPEKEWLRVTLTCEGPQPGLSDQVRQMLPNALAVQIELPSPDQVEPTDIRSKSARELFAAYLAGRYPSEPNLELLDLFDSLLTEAEGELRAGQLTVFDEPEGPDVVATDVPAPVSPEPDAVDVAPEAVENLEAELAPAASA